jgi:hypothetical protein
MAILRDAMSEGEILNVHDKETCRARRQGPEHDPAICPWRSGTESVDTFARTVAGGTGGAPDETFREIQAIEGSLAFP